MDKYRNSPRNKTRPKTPRFFNCPKSNKSRSPKLQSSQAAHSTPLKIKKPSAISTIYRPGHTIPRQSTTTLTPSTAAKSTPTPKPKNKQSLGQSLPNPPPPPNSRSKHKNAGDTNMNMNTNTNTNTIPTPSKILKSSLSARILPAKTRNKTNTNAKRPLSARAAKPKPSAAAKSRLKARSKTNPKSKMDSPRPSFTSMSNRSSKSEFKSKTMAIPEIIPEITAGGGSCSNSSSPKKTKVNNFNLVQSRSSPIHAGHAGHTLVVDEHLINNKTNGNTKPIINNNTHNNHVVNTSITNTNTNTNTNIKKKKKNYNYLSHSRDNSISHQSVGSQMSQWSENTVTTIDAVTFNSLHVIQDIGTYRVTFTTRVCGIELVPFDYNSNLGASVIKCHTAFSQEKVEIDSLLVSINGKLCIETDYDEILEIISSSSRPLKLTFHPPTQNKNDMIDEISGRTNYIDHKSRPSLLMKLDDDWGVDNEYQIDSFIHPNSLFSYTQNKDQNQQLIQRNYKILYHKYCELEQFQELTKDTIHNKMNEIKRLTKENISLKTILNEKESQLQRVQINQSTEIKR